MTRNPAPGELALVERFINTADVESGADEIDDPGKLTGWLREAGLMPADEEARKADVDRVLAVREALRGLTLANNGGPPYPVDPATPNPAAPQSSLRGRSLAPRSAPPEGERA